MDLWEALDLWLTTLAAEGRRPATLKAYREHLRPLFKALANGKALEDLNPFAVRRYFAEYGKAHSPHSARTVFASLRAFVNFCRREGLLASSPLGMRPPAAPLPNRAVYKPGELKALLASLGADRTPLGLRDAAIISLLLDTGLRASEACALALEDLQGEALLLRRTKTGRPRMLFLGKRSSQALHRYLALGRPRLHPRDASLFLTQDGRPLNRGALRLMLERRGKELGVKLSAHRFRHTWATQMLRSGVDLETLRLLGGWADYTMLKTYTHLAGEDLREAMRRHSPLDRL